MSNIPNRIPNVVTAAGLVTPSEYNHINAGGVLALTLGVPTVDGQTCSFVDETGKRHSRRFSNRRTVCPRGVVRASAMAREYKEGLVAFLFYSRRIVF